MKLKTMKKTLVLILVSCLFVAVTAQESEWVCRSKTDSKPFYSSAPITLKSLTHVRISGTHLRESILREKDKKTENVRGTKHRTWSEIAMNLCGFPVSTSLYHELSSSLTVSGTPHPLGVHTRRLTCFRFIPAKRTRFR